MAGAESKIKQYKVIYIVSLVIFLLSLIIENTIIWAAVMHNK